MGGLRWTHKATRNLALALRRRGVSITHVTVGRLLREMKYSLRTNRKRQAKTNDPDRDQQFRLLARRRRRFQCEQCPVISIDCKKKELLGPGGPGWLPTQVSHRSGRVELPHPVPPVMVSLRDVGLNGPRSGEGADNAPSCAVDSPSSSDPHDYDGITTSSTHVSRSDKTSTTTPSCP